MFAPHMDTGDHVIVVNAAGIRMTGAKAEQKVYYRHSGFPGGLREQRYARLLAERPTMVVEKAVRGMLPKTRLGRQMISKLAVYAGPEHPHAAQKPQPMALGDIPPWEGIAVPKPPKPKKATSRASTSPAAPASTARAGAAGAGQESAGSGRRPTRSAKAAKPAKPTAPAAKRGSGSVSTARRSRSKSETKES
jgi:large subunit ribosomal protein L13